MKNILVVDDNKLNCDLARAMLTRAGYQVRTAESAEAALKVLGEEAFDVVVTDIGMPRISGIELCAMIRAAKPSDCPRIVAFTSFAMPSQREAVMAAGFDAIVTKPATRQMLVAAADPDSGVVAGVVR